MKVSLIQALFLKASLTVAAVMLPFAFFAASGPAENLSQSAFRVKFIGGDNEALQFNVKYNNKERSNFKLLVLDETGEALFEDNYTKDLDKRLTIPRLTDSDHVIFILRSVKEKVDVSFKVKITTRVVDGSVAAK